MKNKKKYYDLDKDESLKEDYYDSLGEGKVNFVSGYIHRERFLLTEKLVNNFYKKGKIIVDFGCGNCSWNAKKLPVVGVDNSKRLLEYSLKKKQISKGVCADITKNTGLANNSADIIVITETLEHFLNPSKILKEIYRVLKPGGVVIASVPYDIKISLWKPMFAVLCFYQGNILGKELYKNKCGHVQNFSPSTLKTIFINNNFQYKEQLDVYRFTQFIVCTKE